MNEPTGTCKYDRETHILTITTMAKRGTKMVENKVQYLVEDIRPDTRVADPAYSLTKGELVPYTMEEAMANGGETHKFVPSEKGEIWHVHVDKNGPGCSCPHATYHPNSPACKHCKAMQAVGLLRKRADHE